MRSISFLLTISAMTLGSAAILSADVVVGTTNRTGYNDSVNWGQLGLCNQTVASTFSATSSGGLTVTGSEASGHVEGDVQRNADSSGGCSYNGWFGNFAPGDNLIFTGFTGLGPLTLGFSTGVSGAGLQIMRNAFGAFTATIDAYNGATLLGSFSEGGTSAFTADNSAIFIGINDLSGPNITSIVINTDSSDFAVNQLSLLTNAVPEPSSIGMALLLGLGVLTAAHRRRKNLSQR